MNVNTQHFMQPPLQVNLIYNLETQGVESLSSPEDKLINN